MKLPHYLTFVLLLSASLLHATHNRAGEIIFRKTGGLSVEATIITVTKASSINADRDTLMLCWGDGSCLMVARLNGDGELLGSDRKKNIYKGVHTYLAEGVYTISMTDPNRNGGILNVNYPTSDNVPFHLESTIRLLPDAEASSSSPVFLELPVDVAFAFQPFTHIPNAFDPDGDSLAYELVTPMQAMGIIVPNYVLPDQIGAGDDNKISFDPVTGRFDWDTPIIPGAYNIAILVRSYRNGLLVETVLRDITIDVYNQANHPPAMAFNPDPPTDVVEHVMVGQTIEITVVASDPDPGQSVQLTATGGPFEPYFQENATFVNLSAGASKLTWHVGAEYLRNQPYQFVIKAKDDLFGDGLASFRVLRFKVVEAVGVQQASAPYEALSIVPNPASDDINIQFPAALSDEGQLQLIDLQGNVVYSALLSSGLVQTKVHLTGQSAGVYSLMVQTADGKRFTGRLMKI